MFKKHITLIIMTLLLVLIANMGVSTTSAKTSENTMKYDPNDKVTLSEYHKDLLRCYGLTDSDINSLTLGELRNIIKYGKIKDLSYIKKYFPSMGTPSYENPLTDDMKKKLFAKGLSINQIDYLMDEGYIPSEILSMSTEKLISIFENTKMVYKGPGENNNTSAYVTAAPPGYTLVPIVPDGGGIDEWFHPNAQTTTSTITDIVYKAKSICQNVFYSLETSKMRWSYYLFGEWGEDPGRETWCHEGIDLQYTITNPQVTSRVHGYVVLKGSSYVNIYDDYFDATVNYQHLTNIPSFIYVGAYIYNGTRVGYVNPADNHVHVQVCDHTNCLQVHSGQDLNLECISPYGILFWYAKLPVSF